MDALNRGNLRDAKVSAREVAETLQDWLNAYERMMSKAGRDLPY